MMPNSFGQYATSNRETYLLFAYCSVPTDSGAAGWFEGSPGAPSPSESTTDLVPQFCLDIVEFSFSVRVVVLTFLSGSRLAA